MVWELQRQGGILLNDSAAGQDEAEMLRERERGTSVIFLRLSRKASAKNVTLF